MTSNKKPLIFHLDRVEDFTGVSGTGTVAWGVEFGDGKVALRWATATASTAIYDSIEAVAAIHGHEGRTQVVFEDPNQDEDTLVDAYLQGLRDRAMHFGALRQDMRGPDHPERGSK